MRSIGFPELLVTLVVIALLVGIFKSRRKGNKRQEPVATTRSSTSGSSGYIARHRDRKSTRLNSSHANLSYAVFCLNKNPIASSPVRPCLVQWSHRMPRPRRKDL